MFLYTEIEDQIIEHLKLFVPSEYNVIALPEKEKDFKKGPNKLSIIIWVTDCSFEPSSSMSILRQEETVNLVCLVQSSKLRGNYSIQEALYYLKLLLIGFKPGNLSKLSAQKIDLVNRDAEENYFEYSFTFSAKKLHVEVLPEEILPLLKKVTLYNTAVDAATNVFIPTDILLEVTDQNFSLPII